MASTSPAAPLAIRTFARAAACAVACAAAFAICAHTPAAAQKRTASAIIPGGKSNAPISINAGRLDFLDKESKLVYSGGVVASQGDATLKCSKLTIFLVKGAMKNAQSGSGSSGDQIERMEAAGPVTITSKDQVGTGNSGLFDKKKNVVYLIGNPVLTQGSNITRGGPKARLVYDLNSGRARISGGGRVTSVFVPGGNRTPARGSGSGNRR